MRHTRLSSQIQEGTKHYRSSASATPESRPQDAPTPMQVRLAQEEGAGSYEHPQGHADDNGGNSGEVFSGLAGHGVLCGRSPGAPAAAKQGLRGWCPRAGLHVPVGSNGRKGSIGTNYVIVVSQAPKLPQVLTIQPVPIQEPPIVGFVAKGTGQGFQGLSQFSLVFYSSRIQPRPDPLLKRPWIGYNG